jgi:hypothetical protein
VKGQGCQMRQREAKRMAAQEAGTAVGELCTIGTMC